MDYSYVRVFLYWIDSHNNLIEDRMIQMTSMYENSSHFKQTMLRCMIKKSFKLSQNISCDSTKVTW